MSHQHRPHDLVLASTSPWRKALLESAGIRVLCRAPGVDESAYAADGPISLARVLACAKADAVARAHPEDLVLGADQVAWDGVETFGKPANVEDHFRRLCSMRGRVHELVTAVCLRGPMMDVCFEEITRMHVRADISDEEIRRYVETGEGSGCAGGYAAEALGMFLFERVEGCWQNVIGLPVPRVLTELRRGGWRFGGSNA